MPNMIAHRSLARDLMEGLSRVEKDFLLNLMITQSELELIEEKMPQFVRELKEKEIPALALTGILSGGLESIPDMTSWRVESLKSFGYDFSYSFPEVPPITLEHFSKAFDSYPKYAEGVLITNGSSGSYTKGDVLITFFELAAYHPQKGHFS